MRCEAIGRPRAGWLTALWLMGGVAAGPVAAEGEREGTDRAPVRAGEAGGRGARGKVEDAVKVRVEPPVPLTSTLDPRNRPIDLNIAMRLAGVQNPELMISRQRIVEAVAARQFAAAQILPTINIGTNYDAHTGNLQQSNGNILSVNRSALYVGAGANAVAAGTVNIPGVFLGGNVAEGVFGFLVSRQVITERTFANAAARNQVLGEVGLAYSELLRAEGRRAVALQVRDEANEVYRLVAAYSKVGVAKKSDADRAATELARRQADVQRAEGDIQVASARLCDLLNLDPSIRLHPTDAWVVPAQIVPPPVPVCELIAMALLRRPELGERRAVIRQAFLALQGSKILPFSPTVLVGFSAGGFGGGSNLVQPVFGGFGGRTDLDAVAYWSIRNLGVGNAALINQANARLQTTRFQEIAVMDRIRAEVAEAYAKSHARFAQIASQERAVRSATDGFNEDLTRARGAVGLPIEVLDSLRLLAQARGAYLDAIVDYNRAQFELYVAMGQPPADALARPRPHGGGRPRRPTGPVSPSTGLDRRSSRPRPLRTQRRPPRARRGTRPVRGPGRDRIPSLIGAAHTARQGGRSEMRRSKATESRRGLGLRGWAFPTIALALTPVGCMAYRPFSPDSVPNGPSSAHGIVARSVTPRRDTLPRTSTEIDLARGVVVRSPESPTGGPPSDPAMVRSSAERSYVDEADTKSGEKAATADLPSAIPTAASAGVPAPSPTPPWCRLRRRRSSSI